MRAAVIAAVKLAVSIGIFLYLIDDVRDADPAAFAALDAETTGWSLLAGATLFYTFTMALMWLRWSIHLGTLGLHFPLVRVAQAGGWAYVLDFLAFGATGGDVAKGLLLAWGRPRERWRVMASVVIDRATGLLCLLSFVATAIAVCDFGAIAPEVRLWMQAVQALAAAGIVVAAALLLSARRLNRILPFVPAAIRPSIEALRFGVQAYRTAWPRLIAAAAVSFVMLPTQVLAFHMIALALPGAVPTYWQHTVIVPLAMISSVVPLPGNALGVLDYAMTFLTEQIGGGTQFAANTLFALGGLRLIEIALAAIILLATPLARRRG